MVKRTSFFGVSSRWSYRSSIEPVNLSSFGISGWGIDLDYCDVEWSALEKNREHSVVYEIAAKYCSSEPFVVYEGYSFPPRDSCPQ